jgi:uncharacterized protein YbdZ (MbtH family)
MRLSPRLGFRLILVAILVAIIALRLIPRHPARPHAPSIPDRSATNPLNQPGGGPAPAEAYPVYSALYQNPPQTPSPTQPPTQQDEPLVFAAESRTDIPQVGGSCLQPSTPAEHEMADAFVAANQQSHLWEQKLTIPQGYTLLSPAEEAQLQACLGPGRRAPACQSWKGVQHIRYLGVPGFDHTHTHALVSVIKQCGTQCGSGGIFEVEKAGSTWKRSAATDFTSDCSWIY